MNHKSWVLLGPLLFILCLEVLAGEKENLELLKQKFGTEGSYYVDKNATLKFTIVDNLPGGALSSILPEYGKDQNLTVHLRITKEAMKDQIVVMENIERMANITNEVKFGHRSKRAFAHAYNWAEAVENARAGSLAARETLLLMELEVAKSIPEKIKNKTLVSETDKAAVLKRAKEKILKAEAHLAEASRAARADLKKKKAAWEKRKIAFSELEKDEVKFDDLVMKNDRKGVRKMLETYLPWELMEPSEVKNWKTWLDVIEKPKKSEAVLVFRGLDTNPYLKPREAGSPGLLSSVLMKNQGNYTRRLRSLTTLRESIGVNIPRNGFETFDRVPHVTTMMSNHAADPKGSPFLSVSDLNVARAFGDEEMVAMKIDRRRMISNVLGIETERERLIPLVVFPDEIVHYEDFRKSGNTLPDFKRTVEAKIGRKLTPFEEGDFEPEFQKQFLNDAYNDLQDVVGHHKKKCETLMSTLNHLLQ